MKSNINRLLGQNIAEQRIRRGITQREIAERLSETCGRTVSTFTVSSWEHGNSVIPAAVIPAICKAIGCSSYDLYPHSPLVDDSDIRFVRRLSQMPERQKAIWHYMVENWRGDTSALWEFGLLYAVLPEYRRQYIAHAGVSEFRDAFCSSQDEIDNANGLRVDLAKIIRAMNALDKEE